MNLIESDEEAPDFDVEEAFGELFTVNRTIDSNPYPGRTKAEWATRINLGNIALPPPQWWIDQQDTKGRQKSKFAIWNSRYDHGRKLGIWIMAPLDDFRRAKFLRPAKDYTR